MGRKRSKSKRGKSDEVARKRSLAATKAAATRKKNREQKERTKRKRSLAAKRGWETRRYKAEERRAIQDEQGIPPGFREVGTGSVKRSRRQRDVFEKARIQAQRLLLDAQEKAIDRRLKRPERLLSKRERIRVQLSALPSFADLESQIYDIAGTDEADDLSAHELFELFFSPEAA